MRSVAELDSEIARVKQEMEDARGAECEVYARIVGYYRSVKNWNKGKREEYKERKMFSQPSCGNPQPSSARLALKCIASLGSLPMSGKLQANEAAAGAHVVKESAV